MAETISGPMCSTRCGPGWIDDGTMCRAQSTAWIPTGVGGQTKCPTPPTITQEKLSALKRKSSKKRGKIPSLDDCKKKMQSNLPKAHVKAIEMLSYTIEFFKYIFVVVSTNSNIEDIMRCLGKRRINFLFVYWHIYIEPKAREWKGLEPRPTRLHLFLEILHPVSCILSVYKKIKAGLEKGNTTYECEYKGDILYKFNCEGIEGYVHTAFGKPFGDIHICVDEITNVDDITVLAEKIIHEASHMFAGTDDDSEVPWENAHVVEMGIPPNL